MIDVKSAAYHEAGHAVAAYLMRKRFGRVSIVPNPDDEPLGRVALPPSYHSGFNPDVNSFVYKTRVRIEVEIIILFAGAAAEIAMTGEGELSGTDFARAADLAMYVTGSEEETKAYLEWLWVRTKDMLNLPEHKRAVQALADELLIRQELGYYRVRRIIRQARGERT